MFLNIIVEGGLFFTLPILALILVIIFVFIKASKDVEQKEQYISRIAAISVFALALGVLGQVIGLIEGFKMMEQVEGVSPKILAGGLRVSSIATLFGLVAFVIGRLLIIVLQWKNK